MDKAALGKSIVICGLSWAAIPFLYYMFRKRERKDKNGSKNEEGNVGKAIVKTGNDSK